MFTHYRIYAVSCYDEQNTALIDGVKCIADCPHDVEPGALEFHHINWINEMMRRGDVSEIKLVGVD